MEARVLRCCRRARRAIHVFGGNMTRRDLGKLATAGALLQTRAARGQSAKKYTGALDGFEAKVVAKNFDPVAYTATLSPSAPLRMTFKAKTRKQAETWQTQLRAKVTE